MFCKFSFISYICMYYTVFLQGRHECVSVCPDCCSDEEDLPGWSPVSPLLAMATPYFPTFLLLILVSSVVLFLLTLMPSVTPSLPSPHSSPSSPWTSSSCGPGQSWAVRLHPGRQHEEDEDVEQDSLDLDVIADRVGIRVFTPCYG